MKRAFAIAAIVVALATLVPQAFAQRRINPVEPEQELRILTKEEVKQVKDRAKAEQHYADSLAKDSIKNDTTKLAGKIKHPKLMNVAVGLNIWDPLMRAFGKNYGGGSVWGAVNFYNKYIPVAELGIGMANDTPEDGNYTYKGKTAVFTKAGMNYNFMADKDSRYQLYAGLRFGWSAFRYDITDITVGDGYWADEHSFDILDQKSHAFWGEFLVGLQVNIVKNFSIGWALRYQVPFSIKDNINSRPWYIPGYGIRDNKLNVNLSLIYEFPLHPQTRADK